MRSIPFSNMNRRGCRGKFVGLLNLLAVGGVLAAAVMPPAWAEDGGFHPLDSLLRTMDLKTDVGRPPDFVEASRPKADTDFVPVGAPHPQAAIKVKSPAELKAAEASLDAARMHHDKIAGRKPPEPKAAAGKAAVPQAPKPPQAVTSATQN